MLTKWEYLLFSAGLTAIGLSLYALMVAQLHLSWNWSYAGLLLAVGASHAGALRAYKLFLAKGRESAAVASLVAWAVLFSGGMLYYLAKLRGWLP